jgi:hypothetical protein
MKPGREMTLSSRFGRWCIGIAGILYLGLPTVASAHDSLGDLGGTIDRGAVNAYTNDPEAWVRKYFAPAGICLLLKVEEVSPPADLEMVVISPDPRVRYRDDNGGHSGSCAACPQIQIDPTPRRGFYTVIISGAAGQATNADFRLSYFRLQTGSPSCSSPENPLSYSTRKRM